MKITGHVLEMRDCGDEVEITAQGKADNSADWRPWTKITFRLPALDGVKRSYWLGRKVTIEVKPA